MRKIRLILLFVLTSSWLVNAQLQQSLSYYANKYDSLRIGTCITSDFYNTPVYDTGRNYDKQVKANFNILVAENEMKFDAIEPQQGIFNFTDPDLLVAYGQKYHMQVRGHNFCWHSQLPSWITAGFTNGVANGKFTRGSLMAILKHHIDTIVGRYKGKVQEWDVVNEPFNDGSGTLRNSIWQQVIGNDYIDSAFVWTHRDDPQAKLYINDYNVEYLGTPKADSIFNYLKSMRKRNIPITGGGFQCHFTCNTINFKSIDANMKRYAAAGLEAIITELDDRILVTNYNTNSELWLGYQAEDYRQMIDLCLNNPNAKTFVMWGFTDRYSWIPQFTSYTYDYALIFNGSYVPKPAYTSILNELAINSGETGVNNVQKDSNYKFRLLDGQAIFESESQIIRLKIYNVQGVCLFQKNNSTKISIPLTRLQKGIYIAEVQIGNNPMSTTKFIW